MNYHIKCIYISHMISERESVNIDLERVCHKMSKQRWKQKPEKEMEAFYHKVAKQYFRLSHTRCCCTKNLISFGGDGSAFDKVQSETVVLQLWFLQMCTSFYKINSL